MARSQLLSRGRRFWIRTVLGPMAGAVAIVGCGGDPSAFTERQAAVQVTLPANITIPAYLNSTPPENNDEWDRVPGAWGNIAIVNGGRVDTENPGYPTSGYGGPPASY